MAAAPAVANERDGARGQERQDQRRQDQRRQDQREEARWKPVLGLHCELTVDLPLPDFKVADLLKLRPGSVIDARWRVGQDVPLRLNGTLIAWIEFEVVGDRLAVRVTELAPEGS